MPKKIIIGIIDFFYPPFKRIMPLQTFRYAACGGSNTLWDTFAFWLSYNFILHQKDLNLGFITFKAHIAALLMAFLVSFPTGYFLNSQVVFTESTLDRRVQLFRYFVLVVICLILNYVFIKLFVEVFHIYPTVAKIMTMIIVVSFSYITQKNYTFKAEKAQVPPGK